MWISAELSRIGMLVNNLATALFNPMGSDTPRKKPISYFVHVCRAIYDAIVVGTPTRFERIASQMAAFLDQAEGLGMSGALNGKVGGAFTSTASQHGGQEATLFSVITKLLHFGMTIIGLPYSYRGQLTLDEITGGSGNRAPTNPQTGAGVDPAPATKEGSSVSLLL